MVEYPCKECIVKNLCSKACDKVSPSGFNLFIRFYLKKYCPDCGCTRFNVPKFIGRGNKIIYIICMDCRRSFNMILYIYEARSYPIKTFPMLSRVNVVKEPILNSGKRKEQHASNFIHEVLIPRLKIFKGNDGFFEHYEPWE
jgi:hypothetical protein